MSYLSEAHTEWHIVNGRTAVCPLDCGAGEPDPWEDMTDEDIAEYEAWAEAEAVKRADEAPWVQTDPDFLPGGPHFDPPF